MEGLAEGGDVCPAMPCEALDLRGRGGGGRIPVAGARQDANEMLLAALILSAVRK